MEGEGEMENFRPPKELLEKIGFGIMRINFLRFNAQNYAILEVPVYSSPRFYRIISVSVITIIKESFSFKIVSDEKEFAFGQSLLNRILLEMLSNVAKHGTKKGEIKKIKFGIWLGEKGFVLGIKDESGFFSKEETRKQFESRRVPAAKGGLEWIFDPHVSDVRVSAAQSALFLSFLIDSLLD